MEGSNLTLEGDGSETKATDPLTQRESEVLEYLAQGQANKQISARLGISEHTVKFHISSIYAKMRRQIVRRQCTWACNEE